MTTIGQVIGWKFNHQQGMVTKAGVITKFPGGIPSQADQDTWTAEYLVEFPEGFDEWEEAMQRTDESMPRYAEDILDGMPNKLSVAKITLDRLQAKKDLRATKP
jgi:hypothetical protein